MPEPFAVIFDMDGVLIDSYQAHLESWRQLAGENGCEYSEQNFVRGFGRTSREVLVEQWVGGPQLTESRIRELADRKEALFREIITQAFPEMDGAVNLINSLAVAGVSMGVGSSGPPENVGLVLDKLKVRGLMRACVTGADVTRGKPDPQVFQIAAQRLQRPPGRCVVIEDAPVGIAAAQRAGMKCVGFASMGRTAEELQSADLVVRSLRELNPARLGGLFVGKEDTAHDH